MDPLCSSMSVICKHFLFIIALLNTVGNKEILAEKWIFAASRLSMTLSCDGFGFFAAFVCCPFFIFFNGKFLPTPQAFAR
jgi:hypothetical protein